MGCKIVFIGGGSYHWTATIVKDLFLRKGLDGSELVLVDVDEEAASIMTTFCRMLAAEMDVKWQVSTAPLEQALDGADYVNVSISTGGFDVMERDYRIPEAFGIYHTVGDTVGPAGISRSLRNIPVFVDIAQKMERYCPDAWMLHLTNPLTQLTRAVCKTTSIKCAGLCHGFAGTLKHLAAFLDAEYDEMDAMCVGVNHYIWLKHITCQGKDVSDRMGLSRYLDYMKQQTGHVLTNTTDDELAKAAGEPTKNIQYLPFELYERFGYFPGNGSPHIAENFPHILNSEAAMQAHRIWRKGVLPWRQESRDNKREEYKQMIAGIKPLTNAFYEGPSYEYFAYIVDSLHTNAASRAIVAMPNQGQITNLPRDVVVETWAMVSGNGIHPVLSGEIPRPLLGSMQLIIDEQECTVEAALTGDRHKLLQALFVSPMVQDKDCIEALADELLVAQKEYLPQFGQE